MENKNCLRQLDFPLLTDQLALIKFHYPCLRAMFLRSMILLHVGIVKENFYVGFFGVGVEIVFWFSWFKTKLAWKYKKNLVWLVRNFVKVWIVQRANFKFNFLVEILYAHCQGKNISVLKPNFPLNCNLIYKKSKNFHH